MNEEIEVEDRRPKFAMIEEWIFDRVKDDGAYRLYGLLAMSVHGKGFMLSRAQLAGRCGCSVDTIDRRLRYLREVGVLEVRGTTFKGGTGWNKYILLGPPRGGRKSAARVAAPMRRGEPQICGPYEQKELNTKTETPQPPSGGRRAICADCGKEGRTGQGMSRVVDSTAPKGQKTLYLHDTCKPPARAGSTQRISGEPIEEWLK